MKGLITHLEPFYLELFGDNMIKNFLLGLKGEGWTQKAIAEKVGVQPNMISKFINGKTCTLETLIKFADAFNVSTDAVLGREDPKPKANCRAEHLEENQRAIR